MNPNDIVAQQQALLNQALNQAHEFQWAMVGISVVGTVLTAWVIYLFYARLREIAQELQKLRIAYEFANAEPIITSSTPSTRATDDHSRYMPKA